MIRKKNTLLKEYKIAIIIAISIIITGTLLTVIYVKANENKIKEFKNEYYTFKYNTSWKIKDNNQNSISLINKENSTLDIKIVTLEDEYRYLPIEDILDEFLYNMQNQNKDYNLLFKEKYSITKNNYEGYKMLYENDKNQAMIIVYKIAEKLIICKYEADNTWFDILLDSAQDVIYNFDIVDKEIELTYKIQLDTNELNWNSNQEIISQLKDTKNYEIAYKNYLVNFSIPSNFELNDFDSTSKQFNYKGLTDGKVSLDANIHNCNIYEYVENSGTLFNYYKYIREGEEYSDFQENIKQMELESGIGYIYKNSYIYAGYSGDTNYEEVVLIYELDTSHIFTVKINATEVSIPEELVTKIGLNSSKNYSSYINNKIENGNLICELKEFIDYEKTDIQLITLKIPQKYTEIDKNYNIYEHRNYGLNYNEKMEIYEYNIEYEICTSTNSKIDVLNSNYNSHKNKGTYKELEYKETLALNGKTFDIYEGGYTDISGALFSKTEREYYYVSSKVLIYKLDTGKILSIEIKGNDVEISDEILNELTNFNIEIKSKEKR